MRCFIVRSNYRRNGNPHLLSICFYHRNIFSGVSTEKIECSAFFFRNIRTPLGGVLLYFYCLHKGPFFAFVAFRPLIVPLRDERDICIENISLHLRHSLSTRILPISTFNVLQKRVFSLVSVDLVPFLKKSLEDFLRYFVAPNDLSSYPSLLFSFLFYQFWVKHMRISSLFAFFN